MAGVVEIRTSGIKKLNAKFQNITVFTRNEFAIDVVKGGYNNFLVPNIPKDRGELLKATQLIDRKKTASIHQRAPAQNRSNPRPYHLWLNGTGNPSYLRRDGTTGTINIKQFQSKIKSGKVNYMALTAEYIRKNAAKKLTKKINNTK